MKLCWHQTIKVVKNPNLFPLLVCMVRMQQSEVAVRCDKDCQQMEWTLSSIHYMEFV